MPDKNHSVTSIDLVFMLSVAGIYTAPQQVQGYMPDDLFDIDDIDVGESYMGADGNLSAGLVLNMVPQTITLSPNSKSCLLFDAWHAAEKSSRDKYFANGIIQYPAIGMTYTLTTGALVKYSMAASAKKVLQPRKFTINWESVVAIPI